MKTLTIREVRSTLSRLEKTLAREGELIVTRRGRAVARLLPLPGPRPVPSHADLRAQMKRLRRGSEALVREDRDRR